MTSLLARWLAQDMPRDEYRLERVPVSSVDDGLLWMRDWHDQSGRYVWMGAGDEARRRAIKHWQWIKWRHRTVIVARGGQNDA